MNAIVIDRVDPDYSNNFVSILFPDIDGNGMPDICAWPITEFAIYGTQSLMLQDRTKILRNHNGNNYFATVAHGGEHNLRIGVNAQAGDVFSNGNPFLANYAIVNGDLVCGGKATLQHGASVVGNTIEYTEISPSLPALNLSVNWILPGENITLYPDTSMSLEPGSYGRVVVHGRSEIYLTAGDYYIEQLQLESNSRINIDSSGGSVRIFIKNNAILRGDWVNHNETLAASTLIVYSGQGEVTLEKAFAATIMAPFAKVAVGSGSGHTSYGSIYAREVEIRPDVTLMNVTFTGVIPWSM